MKGISIIICCYNSAERLPKTLEHLANQVVSKNILWNVILVNNNCTDNTVEIAKNEWDKYDLRIEMNIVDELQSGLLPECFRG